MQSNQDFGANHVRGEIDYAHGTFVGDEPFAIYSHPHASSRWTSDAVRIGAAASPIADVDFSSTQHDLKRSNPDVPKTEHFACSRIQFCQPIGEIQSNVKTSSVTRNRQAGRNFGLALGRFGSWQTNGV